MSKISRRDWLKWSAAGAAGLGLGAFSPYLVGGPSRGLAQMLSATEPRVARAKRVVYLFMAGGPSQLESFDPKPGLAKYRNTELPASVRGDKRITTMTSGQGKLNVANSLVDFKQYGQSGMWVSDLFPHIAEVVDDLCLVKSVYCEAVNHDPATNLALTGSQLVGRPSIGSWVSYGLGSANPGMPSFVAMSSQSKVEFVQPLTKRLWSSAFLPVTHQGVAMRPGNQPVLWLNDGVGLKQAEQRQLFDAVAEFNKAHFDAVGHPGLLQHNDAYDLAANLQTSVAELADTSDEPDEVFELYGPNAREAGSFAANCLRARRLLERDVRFVMLLHRGWDHHYNVTAEMGKAAGDTDQPTAALIKDLKRTGLLEDTLFIWGGEFGRTAYSQGDITDEDHGRDHHPYCFPVLLAGGGVRVGQTFGETDDFSYNVVENPVHVHDLHATILHILGLDQYQLTFRNQGRDFKLTDLGGKIVDGILS